jgi:gliding motility-associated-like protein
MLRKLRIINYILLFFYTTQTITGQETLRNNGQMRTHSASQVGFHGDFTNDQVFSNNRGRAYFVGAALQTIQGNGSLLQFDNVILNNANSLIIRTPVLNSILLDFQKGCIVTPRNTPSVSWMFGDNGGYTGASNTRHIHGYVAKVGNDTFSFPIGDGQRLRPAAISQPNDTNAIFRAAYFRGSPSGAILPIRAPFPINRISDRDLKISNNEYWDIDGSQATRITLTWNNIVSRVDTLSEFDISRIVVAGWDGTEWVNLGATSVVGDIRATGQVTSRDVVPDSFDVFTIAVYKKTCFAVNTPTLNLGNDKVFCYNDTFTLKPAKGFSRYEWQDGSDSSIYIARTSGRYWVKAYDICGNYQVDTLFLRAARPIAINIDPVKCYGESNGSITLSDTTNMGIFLNDRPKRAYQMKNLGANTYHLIVKLAEGCTIDTTFDIEQSSLSRIDIGQDTIHIQDGQSVTLTATVGIGLKPVQYSWSPPQYLSCSDCASTVARPIGKVTYIVQAIDSAGCAAVDEITVYVDKKFGVYIPNAFNPDREEFTVLSNGEVNNVRKMQIFDRWGTLLFEAQNFKPDGSVGWNGTHRNKPMMRGTYVVSLELEFKDGDVKTLASEFLLAQ